MSNPYDQTRDPRTGRPPLPATDAARARREERDALEEAVSALEGAAPPEEKGRDAEQGERPEALAQFAESARHGEESPKSPTADKETAPRPASNEDKHEVAASLLNEGAGGENPDPHAHGVDRLPDRIIDRG